MGFESLKEEDEETKNRMADAGNWKSGITMVIQKEAFRMRLPAIILIPSMAVVMSKMMQPMEMMVTSHLKSRAAYSGVDALNMTNLQER